MTKNIGNDMDAVISECGKYRYALTRRVGLGERAAAFIMLNPSTADATLDDPTIRRCMGFARQMGCGKLLVLNLFAVRATDPADMRAADDPVGADNKAWFDRYFKDWGRIYSSWSGPVICGWGVHGSYMEQDETILGWLESYSLSPMTLGTTKEGFPKHPLYVPYSADLGPYLGRRTHAATNPNQELPA